MNGQDPLSQLRDLHLPHPFWALINTPIFWLALIACLLLAYFIFKQFRQYQNKMRYRKAALKQLIRIKTISSPEERLSELNILLKQTALTAYKTEDVASLTGNAWINFLDRSARTDQFTQGPGKLLLAGPYSKTSPSDDLAKLVKLAEQWIKDHQPC